MTDIPPPSRSYHRLSDMMIDAKEEKSRYFRQNILPLIAVVTAGLGAGAVVGYYSLAGRIIPADETVQPGSIAPNQVHIGCYDYDKDGKLETIETILGEPYRLEYKEGKAILEPLSK